MEENRAEQNTDHKHRKKILTEAQAHSPFAEIGCSLRQLRQLTQRTRATFLVFNLSLLRTANTASKGVKPYDKRTTWWSSCLLPWRMPL
jgi:hypothetical protein